MKIFDSIAALTADPAAPAASVVTIGNFDGCHIGHQRLIGAAAAMADKDGVAKALCTFDPNPHLYFKPDASFRPLFTLAQKIAAFRSLGIDLVLIQPFHQAFSRIDHQTFFHRYLHEGFRAKGIVIGEDFRFGLDRRGNTRYLQQEGAAYGIDVKPMAQVEKDGAVVSSSRIRQLLVQEGAVQEAARLLGRPYCLEGSIVSGDKLGRTIGVPTANLAPVAQLIPLAGIYAGHVALYEQRLEDSCLHVPKAAIPAVFSIGVRPTVAAGLGLCVEAHLLEGTYGQEGLYGMQARYFLRHRLREERRYPNFEELKAQINADIKEARHKLASS